MNELKSARVILADAFYECGLEPQEVSLFVESVIQELINNGYDFGYDE